MCNKESIFRILKKGNIVKTEEVENLPVWATSSVQLDAPHVEFGDIGVSGTMNIEHVGASIAATPN